MKTFLILSLLLVIVGWASAVKADELEAFDSAMAKCVGVVAPGYIDMIMTGEVPENVQKKDMFFTPDKTDNLEECMELQGFSLSASEDFSAYKETFGPYMEDLEGATVRFPKQEAETLMPSPAERTKTRLYNEKTGKERKFIYVPKKK